MGAINTLCWQARWHQSHPPSPCSAPNQGRALADACALCRVAADKPMCWSQKVSLLSQSHSGSDSLCLPVPKQSSVVPAGTQRTRSLKGPRGPATPHGRLCPNQPGWCICKTGLCQPFREWLGAWLQHPGHLHHCLCASRVMGAGVGTSVCA